ncbi:DNA polymerase IV [Candidatus Parcubacteria bacterium]|nr:DNA polymerase IV [Candidatus Parcubacteria bacterium]
MTWILHIDGDSFFASVEMSLNPALKGRAVVTGHERGIATAMSKEAKALGIHRGMPVYQIKKLYPQAIIVRSDYHNYSIFAHRMYNIVRRYAGKVEEYSIDECFARVEDIETAWKVKSDLQKELGMTFSLGLGPTKVIAKVASKWNKPDGFTVIEPDKLEGFLRDMQIGQIWGIGPQTAHHLQRLNIKTALDFIQRSEDWIRGNLGKRELELWHELRGTPVYHVHTSHDDLPGSIQHTRTFNPPTTDKKILFSELSKNVEGACAKARADKLLARKVYYFLKTQEFRYHRFEMALPEPLQTPNEILNLIKETLGEVHKAGVVYRATGVALNDLIPEAYEQKSLFQEGSACPPGPAGGVKNEKKREIFKTIDRLERKYGAHSIILGSSMRALTKKGERVGFHKRFNLPFMGEVV